MSGRKSKHDRKVAKLGAQMVMRQVNQHMKELVKPKPRWIPKFIWTKLVSLVIGIPKRKGVNNMMDDPKKPESETPPSGAPEGTPEPKPEDTTDSPTGT